MTKCLHARERRIGVFDGLERADPHAVDGMAILLAGIDASPGALKPCRNRACIGDIGESAGLHVDGGGRWNRNRDDLTIDNGFQWRDFDLLNLHREIGCHDGRSRDARPKRRSGGDSPK